MHLEPQGLLYIKLTLVDQWNPASDQEPRVFGVNLNQLVEREGSTPKVPLLIQKCVAQIEKRGMKVNASQPSTPPLLRWHRRGCGK